MHTDTAAFDINSATKTYKKIIDLGPLKADVQIVGQPGNLAARNYPSVQKLFGKNHALLSEIEIIWQNCQTFVVKSQLLYLIQICLWNFCQKNSSIGKYLPSFSNNEANVHKLILMKMSKNHALLQKLYEDWLRLPERQELFAGL